MRPRSLLWLALLTTPTAFAIDGTATSDFGFTVRLEGNIPGPDNDTSCSGVLITPGVVLTAAHCVAPTTLMVWPDPTPSPSTPATNFDVHLDPDGDDASPLHSRCHPTEGVGGSCSNDIRPFVSSLNLYAMAGYGDSHQDVALILLDELADADFLLPPGLGGGTCEQSTGFRARVVGYGKPTPFERRTKTFTGFERDVSGGTGLYKEEFVLLPGQYSTFDWDRMDGGDSGGPALQIVDGDTKLCGVASRWAPGPPWALVLTGAQEYAAVDAPDIVDFIKDEIQLADGSLLGHCAADPGSTDDRDNDLIPDACDLCPDTPADLNNLHLANLDSDGDGVGDACDVCPGGDDTIDKDEDGCPDFFACDPCIGPAPGEPGFVEATPGTCGDADLDGICDAQDICMHVPNPGQPNANALAEDVRSEEVWPDACDPVPTTYADPQYNSTYLGQDTQGMLTLKYHLLKQDVFDLRGLQSWPKPGSPVGSLPTSYSNVTNHLRFCQDAAYSGLDCTSPANINDSWLTAATSASTETATDPWHRITLSGGSRGDSVLVDHDDVTVQTVTWDYKSDESFWKTMGLAIPKPSEVGLMKHPDASGLDGVIWIHTVSGVGALSHGAGLANHYDTLEPGKVQSSAKMSGFQKPSKGRDFMLHLPDPPPWENLLTHSILVHDLEGSLATLTSHGMAFQEIADISETALESIYDGGEDVQWIAALDTISAPAGSPVAVAVYSDATAVVDLLAPTDSGTWDLRSEVGDEPANADPEGLSRYGAQVAYHAGMGGLWIASGESSELPGLVRVDLSDEESWAELPTDVDLTAPLAVGYEPGQNDVWVLDTDGESLLLSRFDAAIGGGEVVYKHEISTDRDWWMRLDGQNRVLLIGSGADDTVIVALRGGDDPVVSAIEVLDIPIETAPVVVPEGLVLTSKGDEDDLVLHLIGPLPEKEYELSDLEEYL